VRQIFQVIGTVKKQESSEANVPFFIQFLMVSGFIQLFFKLMVKSWTQAGICARSEKHRALARDELANVSETKFWLLRSVDFVPVLDHLWHGAAAGGRPVKWSDYIFSREAMLPVIM
jgi:hypothetical protein